MNPRISTISKSTLFATALLWLLAVAAPVWAGAAGGTFKPAPGMGSARYGGHTATLLPSAKVLVAGGLGYGSYLSNAEIYDPATGTWAATGSMSSAHGYHTATLLPNGKVLMAGGTNGNAVLSSAEIYDPAAGIWAATGSMSTARAGHTATLLPNGKVLVVGGDNGSAYLSSAEIYDPATGTWAATGGMNIVRELHTATLLGNGQVLVAGGDNDVSGELSSAEIYDSATGTWAATGDMSSVRENHTATLLPDGHVLVAGGLGDYRECLSSAEIYDPVTGTWAATGGMSSARDSQMATMLPNGQVLVSGGFGTRGAILSSAEIYDPAAGTWAVTGGMSTARGNHVAMLLPNGQVLVAGGYGYGASLSSAELFTYATGSWAAVGGMSSTRIGHTTTMLPNGQVLMAGGYSGSYLSSAELFTYATGAWATTGGMSGGREYHTATLLANGKVLVAGGFVGSVYLSNSDIYDPATGTYLSSAEIYDPAAGTWAGTGGMSRGRASHTATLLPDGKVLVAGGSYNGAPLSSAEIYDPAAGTWAATGGMSRARFGHTATLLPNGKVLVAGGINGNCLSSAEIYDPATGTWAATGDMSSAAIVVTGSAAIVVPGSARYGHTATLLSSGQVLVVGGYNNGMVLSSAEIYDPATGTWAVTGIMSSARYVHTATLLPNGQVLVAGGYYYGTVLSSAEVYDPATGSWAATGGMSSARESHTATLLPNGQVLVAGGFNGSLLSSAEIYDAGLQAFAQPQISYATPELVDGSSLTLSGSNFDGLSGGSCGGRQDSPTNYPLVQLRSLDGGMTEFVPWANTSSAFFQSAPLSGFPQGYAYVTVFAGGMSSVSALVDFLPPVALSPVTIKSSNPNGAYAKPGDTVTLSFTASESISSSVAVIAGQNAVVTRTGGNAYQSSITVNSSTPAGPVQFSVEALGPGGASVGPFTATTDGRLVTIGAGPYQVLAVRNGALPGSEGGRVFASFGTPEAGIFGGTYVSTTPSGAKPASAIFDANGNLIFDASGTKWTFNQPSGDALLVTGDGTSTLITGLGSGRAYTETETTAKLSRSSVSIKKILSVDGNGTATFFLATLQGHDVTPANATALEAVVNSTAHIVARQGDTVSIDGTIKKITTLTTFATSPGTAADGRWRVDDNTFGIRVTFADKSQALYEVPATAASSADWTLVAKTTNLAALSGPAAGFGLPSFSGTTQAVLATLPGKKGKAVVNLSNDAVLAQVGATAPGTGISGTDTVMKSLGDPVCAGGGQVAFLGVISGKGINAHNNTGLWYAADGVTPKLIARTGDPASGGGHWARFTSMVMPGAPAFMGTLALSRTDGVTAKNNTGLWASDTGGTVHLLFRTGQTLLVEGVVRTVTSFTALAPAAGSTGAASGYAATGEIPVLANFQDGTQALLIVFAP